MTETPYWCRRFPPAPPAIQARAPASLTPRRTIRPPQGFADLEILWRTITGRLASGGSGSYTSRLGAGGAPSVGRKVIEEAAELAAAALDHHSGRAGNHRVAEEAADLVYHLMVLLAERAVAADEVIEELAARRSGP